MGCTTNENATSIIKAASMQD